MTRRETYERVGGFTEDYVIGDYEDSDLCLKIRRLGLQIAYEPAACLYHFERRSIRRSQDYMRGVASQYNSWLHTQRWEDDISELMATNPKDPHRTPRAVDIRGKERSMSEAALRHAIRAGPADRGRPCSLADRSILGNRFLPQPDTTNVSSEMEISARSVPSFSAISSALAACGEDSRVLDIGCGIGRMAVPLTQYLDPQTSRYDGIDPVEDGIGWCQRTITPAYPNFAFQRLDIAHELYNPNGKISGKALALPFPDQHFDFVIMTSVVTHLPPAEVLVYLAEVRRVLPPAGACS